MPVDIFIENGTISRIGHYRCAPLQSSVINAEGRLISPGFIDIHIQGAGGSDILDGSIESLETISQTCARFGVTGFVATTVFRSSGDNRHLKITADSVEKNLGGARLLGIHLEGPFISPDMRGMILPECICRPSQSVLDEILELTAGSLKIMTIAPELSGSLDIIGRLVQSGIIASFGHSKASFEETAKGIQTGISHVTHLYNAMPSIHHRSPGPLLAIFTSENLSVQIIPDGVHLHPEMVKFTFDLLGEDRCIVITDGMQATGLPDGTYTYNGVEYVSKNGTARYKNGTLIGTALGLNQLLKRFIDLTHYKTDTALRTATENPAKFLGIDGRRGRIAEGMDADLVILDSDFSIWATIINGITVYRK